MFLAKIKGNIVSTPKDKSLIGHKLLLAHDVDTNGKYIGDKDVIALDLISAGIGDLVLICQEGDAIQQMLGHANAPVNTMVVAIVDNLDINE